MYADMNSACRDKDKTKIKFYGAFAAALSYIIYNANKNRKDAHAPQELRLFRGVTMFDSEVDSYKKDSKLQLTGYTSTSQNFDRALEFALFDYSPSQTPVVFEIFFKGKSGLLEIDDDTTAYPGEQEVLLQDGLQYRVLNKMEKETETTREKYTHI